MEKWRNGEMGEKKNLPWLTWVVVSCRVVGGCVRVLGLLAALLAVVVSVSVVGFVVFGVPAVAVTVAVVVVTIFVNAMC